MRRFGLTSTVVLAVVLSVGVLLVGCTKTAKVETPAPPKPTESVEAGQPTQDSPLVVDRAKRAVLVYAVVNRKYVTEPTRHGVVALDGANAEMALFKASAKALDVHKALLDLGATPGDNVKPDSPTGTIVKGSDLDVTVSWGGASYPFTDLIVSKGKLGGKPITPRFGGNKELQTKAKTGCILCLDSCAAGITSNSSVGWKSFDSKLVEFRGSDKLPDDGTPVVISIAVKPPAGQ